MLKKIKEYQKEHRTKNAEKIKEKEKREYYKSDNGIRTRYRNYLKNRQKNRGNSKTIKRDSRSKIIN